jgi:hypothetical protein
MEPFKSLIYSLVGKVREFSDTDDFIFAKPKKN